MSRGGLRRGRGRRGGGGDLAVPDRHTDVPYTAARPFKGFIPLEFPWKM